MTTILSIDIKNMRYKNIAFVNITESKYCHITEKIILSFYQNQIKKYNDFLYLNTNRDLLQHTELNAYNINDIHIDNHNNTDKYPFDIDRIKEYINRAYIIPYVGDIILLTTLSKYKDIQIIIQNILDIYEYNKNIFIVYIDDISDEKLDVVYLNNNYLTNIHDDDYIDMISYKLISENNEIYITFNDIKIKMQLTDYTYSEIYKNTFFIMKFDNYTYKYYINDENNKQDFNIIKNEDIIINQLAFNNMIQLIDIPYFLTYFTEINNIYLKLSSTSDMNKYKEKLVAVKEYLIKINNMEINIINSEKMAILSLINRVAESYSNITNYIYQKQKHIVMQHKNIFINFNNFKKTICDLLKWFEYFNSLKLNFNSELVDQYMVLITRSTWLDEIMNGNVIGLLLNIKTPILAKLGIIMDRVEIQEISSNLISAEQLCEAQLIYHNEYAKYDNGRFINNAIYGSIIGNGNGILPLYINDIHWSLVKIINNYLLGITINQYPFDHRKLHYQLYPLTLLKFFVDMVSSRSEINEKNIIILIQLILSNDIVFKEIFNHKLDNNNIKSILGNTLITSNDITRQKSLHMKNMITLYILEALNNIKEIKLTNIFIISNENIIDNIDVLLSQNIFNFNVNILDFENIIEKDQIITLFTYFMTWYSSKLLLTKEMIKYLLEVKNNNGYINQECITYFRSNLLNINENKKEIFDMYLSKDDDFCKKFITIIILKMLKKKDNIIDYSSKKLNDCYTNIIKLYINELNK